MMIANGSLLKASRAIHAQFIKRRALLRGWNRITVVRPLWQIKLAPGDPRLTEKDWILILLTFSFHDLLTLSFHDC